MVLNIPIIDQIGERVLYVGIGGGYDILGAVPISYTINKEPSVFVNMGPQQFDGLLRQFYALSGQMGVLPLKVELERIVKKHEIETIIAVDGGVDSLMTGDEMESGTVLQDFVTMAALTDINCPTFLVCLGFGAETEENLNHYRVLENVSRLAASNGFLGTCSLLYQMPAFQMYKTICALAWMGQRKSHIHSRVIAAAEGEFGNISLDGVDANLLANSAPSACFVSPLMSMYWFFALTAVTAKNRLVGILKNTSTMAEAFRLYRQNVIRSRDKQPIPL